MKTSNVIKLSMVLPVILVIFSALFYLHWNGDMVETGVTKYVSHAPIKINGNQDFANQASQEGWPGNGSVENPYMISDYDIDIGETPAGVEIINTTAHFILKNCYLHHSTYFSGGYGIKLENVSNGRVSSVTAENNENGGIYVEKSGNITVDNSTFESTPDEYGLVEIHRSQNITVENCTVSHDNMYGFYIISSSKITLRYNTVSYVNYLSVYLYNTTQSQFVENDIDYVVTNIGGRGMYLENSNYNYFRNNTVYYGGGNDGTAIVLSESDFNQFKGNEIHNGNYGIWLKDSNSNTIFSNYIHDNSIYGIYIVSGSKNRIYLNRFYYNGGTGDTYSGKFQACDNGTGNYWNTSGIPHGYGNYWRDWANNNDTNDQNGDGIVDYPYHVYGSAHNTDYYPLKEPSQVPELNPFIIFIFVITPVVIMRKTN